jgi:hypothetical protein
MTWLALAVVTSIAALTAGAVGWSGAGARIEAVARALSVILLLLALNLFVVAALRETSL